jgi:hypothetical protein
VDYKPKTNAAILLEMAHGKDKQREGNQKLECV